MKYRTIIFLLLGVVFPYFTWAQDTLSIQQLLKAAKNADSPDATYQKYLAAYSESRQIKYDAGLRLTLPELAQWELDLDNTAGALRYLLEELALIENLPYQARKIEVAAKIGDIYYKERLFSEALPYYKLANQQTAVRDEKRKKSILQKLGDTFGELLQPDSAFYFYAQLPVWGAAPEEGFHGQLNVLDKVVKAYSKANEYDKALRFNQRILERMQSENSAKEDLFIIYNNLGYNYNFLKQYQAAIDHFEKSIELSDKTAYETQAVLHTNIGIAHLNLNQFSQAIDALTKANFFLTKINKAESSQINQLLSTVYFKNNDLYNAANFNKIAIENAKKNQQAALLSDAYATATQIYINLFEYETALNYYQQHLIISDSLKQVERQKQQDLLQDKLTLEKADKEIKLLLINQEVKDLTIKQLNLEKEKQILALDKLSLEKDQQQKALILLQQEQAVKEAKLKNQELQAQQVQQQLQITQQALNAAEQEKILTDLAQKEKLQQLTLAQQETQIEAEAQKNTLLQQENEINQLELAQQASFRQFVYGIGGLGFFILCLLLAGWLYSRRTNKQLARQKEEIIAEKNKSDALLLNILPAVTAQELKEKGSATPKRYEHTTVLFADFVNFTGISEKMSPEELVAELNYCFKAFDNIVKKFSLEKIKTIGDAYMCVGGLPVSNQTHPQNAANAAIEMMDFIQQRYQEKIAKGQAYWQMRIGLHSGPVVAGVVGTSKFAYDIWGDTVNTASRMESNSHPFKINLSGRTYELLATYFDFDYRGKIKAKNKGEIDMYFLES